MKYVIMNGLDDFECIGSVCPYSCCIGWRVDVDQKSAEQYREAGGEFGAYLNQNMKEEDGKIRFKMLNGRCAFLDDDNLCMIYKELGRDSLCATCTTYPRSYNTVGDITLCGLYFSCPEAVRLAMFSEKPMDFFFAEETKAGEKIGAPKKGWDYFNLVVRAFNCGMNLLRNRDIPITQRQRLFLLMNRALQDADDAGNMEDFQGVVDIFSDPTVYSAILPEKSDVDLTTTVFFLLKMIPRFLRLNMINEEYCVSIKDSIIDSIKRSVDFLHGGDENLRIAAENLEEMNEGVYEREIEDMLVYTIFFYYFDSVESRLFYPIAVFAVSFAQIYRILSSCMKGKDGIAGRDERIQSICEIARLFNHTGKENRMAIYQSLGNGFEIDLEALYRLID